MIATLILAAGQSSRMGGTDKLLEPINGEALLARQLRRALAVGPTFVTLPDADHPRRVVVPQAAQVVAVAGLMSDSLKAGIAALPAAATGVMILPADMPDITSQDLAAVKTVAQDTGARIVRATTSDGQFGHPTYFARSEFARFATLTGDRGAVGLCAGLETETAITPLNGQRARLDLDTPEDWVRYRANLS